MITREAGHASASVVMAGRLLALAVLAAMSASPAVARRVDTARAMSAFREADAACHRDAGALWGQLGGPQEHVGLSGTLILLIYVLCVKRSEVEHTGPVAGEGMSARREDSSGPFEQLELRHEARWKKREPGSLFGYRAPSFTPRMMLTPYELASTARVKTAVRIAAPTASAQFSWAQTSVR